MDPLDLTAEEFRRLAAAITDLSSNFLTTLDSRPIFPKTSGNEVERLYSTDLFPASRATGRFRKRNATVSIRN